MNASKSTFRRAVYLSFALSVATPAVGWAQDEPSQPTALDRYRAEALEFRIGTPGFGSGSQLHRGGAPVELGFFAGNADMVFRESPAALASIERHRTFLITGFSLWVAGNVILLTELTILLAAPELLISERNEFGLDGLKPLFWGLLGGGAAIGITGGFLMGYSQRHLGDAVVIYNDDLYQRLKGAGAQMKAPGLYFSGSF